MARRRPLLRQGSARLQRLRVRLQPGIVKAMDILQERKILRGNRQPSQRLYRHKAG